MEKSTAFNSNWLAGVLFNGPITVQVTPFTRFGGGLTQPSDLASNRTNPQRAVGQRAAGVRGTQQGELTN